MAQQVFAFSAPVAPVNGRTLMARRCSQAGARKATETINGQCLELLTLYRQQGPLTDAEAAEAMQLERSSVIPRRRELMKRGLVEEIGQRKNTTSGILNTTWGLS